MYVLQTTTNDKYYFFLVLGLSYLSRLTYFDFINCHSFFKNIKKYQLSIKQCFLLNKFYIILPELLKMHFTDINHLGIIEHKYPFKICYRSTNSFYKNDNTTF
ncbi:hypothetical protein M153_220000585 [Pseudoloma neurophilia]|uniref:Uncharacterized protein n=1 Tax=Pseudoloma neurophilia TaxID=146866 RepID=A0A0R0LZ46_9MICR|nr:hypothetical protein M153_220000585 [Pseudoloma neurophilia]